MRRCHDGTADLGIGDDVRHFFGTGRRVEWDEDRAHVQYGKGRGDEFWGVGKTDGDVVASLYAVLFKASSQGSGTVAEVGKSVVVIAVDQRGSRGTTF